MKRTVDGRTAFTFIAIFIVGLLLLMLVLPNSVPIAFVMILFSLFPLVIVIALLLILFGSSKSKDKPHNKKITRIFANLSVICTVLSVFFTYQSTRQLPFEPGTLRYVYENIGVGLLFAAVVFVLLVISRQRFVYWPFWNAKDKRNTDERQMMVRNRVYEKSYRTILLILIAGCLITFSPSSQRMHDELIQVAILGLLGLPSVIAAWQKDS